MSAFVEVEGAQLNLSGLRILPGLINAHDHLQFALFQRLGSGPYPNATAWARDIYHPESEPLRTLLAVPKHLRLMWGGLRNLLCGVTSVHHHDAYHPIFDEDFPVRVVKCAWAHSLEFTPYVAQRFASAPPESPFVIHLAEGTDAAAEDEIFRLHALGGLDSRTVLVHAVGLSSSGWDLVAKAGASVVWCPRSNIFTLGRTLDRGAIPAEVRYALGSDSPLTAPGDFLDEIAYVRECAHAPAELAERMTGASPANIFHLPSRPGDWIAARSFGDPPQLVVRDGRILLIDPDLSPALPPDLQSQFFPLGQEGRPRVLVRWDTRRLFQATADYLPASEIRLGGRSVCVE